MQEREFLLILASQITEADCSCALELCWQPHLGTQLDLTTKKKKTTPKKRHTQSLMVVLSTSFQMKKRAPMETIKRVKHEVTRKKQFILA